MKVGDECRLQTTEGAAWDQKFRERQAALGQNEPEIQDRRDHAFGQAVQKVVSEVKLIHGDAKIRRTLALHLGGRTPEVRRGADSGLGSRWMVFGTERRGKRRHGGSGRKIPRCMCIYPRRTQTI